MKKDQSCKADRKLLVVMTLITMVTVVYLPRDALVGADDTVAHEARVRNRRQLGWSNRCFLQISRCSRKSTSPSICETPGEACVKAVFNLRKKSCEYVCRPMLANNTALPRNTTDVPLWSTNINLPTKETHQNTNNVADILSSLSKNNQSNVMNNITDTAGDSWKRDPSQCTPTFKCWNGGKCLARGFPRCLCPSGWTGTKCKDPCTLTCRNNGTCHNVDGKQLCSCPSRFDPTTNCAKLKPVIGPKIVIQEKHYGYWYVYVIAGCVLLVGILAGYLVLRRLRGKSLLATKVFHFFQPYEDDDGKLFDAFISFKSSNKDFSQSEDEKFVIQTLQPKLEKEFQFTACVHYRDFLPGETIANNIMWAVENSRRTILILSPLYIESEWARLEYQKAQQEMLQLRHKIIPIILEDISGIEIEDPNLKHILSSVTYIEYPGTSDQKQKKKFWEMLELALPKKRSRQSTALSSISVSTPNLTSQKSWQSDATDVSCASEDSAIGM